MEKILVPASAKGQCKIGIVARSAKLHALKVVSSANGGVESAGKARGRRPMIPNRFEAKFQRVSYMADDESKQETVWPIPKFYFEVDFGPGWQAVRLGRDDQAHRDT